MTGELVQIFAIQNQAGQWYTGDLRNGRGMFGAEDDRLQLDADEVKTEMASGALPKDARAVLIDEFLKR